MTNTLISLIQVQNPSFLFLQYDQQLKSQCENYPHSIDNMECYSLKAVQNNIVKLSIAQNFYYFLFLLWFQVLHNTLCDMPFLHGFGSTLFFFFFRFPRIQVLIDALFLLLLLLPCIQVLLYALFLLPHIQVLLYALFLLP